MSAWTLLPLKQSQTTEIGREDLRLDRDKNTEFENKISLGTLNSGHSLKDSDTLPMVKRYALSAPPRQNC